MKTFKIKTVNTSLDMQPMIDGLREVADSLGEIQIKQDTINKTLNQTKRAE